MLFVMLVVLCSAVSSDRHHLLYVDKYQGKVMVFLCVPHWLAPYHMCFASKMPFEQEFVVSARTNLVVNSFTTSGA